jgi:sortase A
VTHGDRARVVVRGLGELLITCGVVVLLFCAYQLVWTNVEANRAQNQVLDDLRGRWAQEGGTPAPSEPSRTPAKKPGVSAVDIGDGLAIIRIPRLGLDYAKPVVQGVSLDDLHRGVGHYPETALPGQVGNFAVAGHRATNGEPFRDLDAVRAGDKVVIETRDTWFTYVVDPTPGGGGHRIVAPADTWVIEPVPGEPAAKPTRKLITLTTCNPRWASTERLIVSGHLESEQPKSDGLPPALEG